MDIEADLCLMDAQRLAFPNAAFDTAVGPFVFCSVPDPVLGLRELGRMVKPSGQILAKNVERAGLEIERVEELAPGGLVKLIIARPRLAARGRHYRQV